MFKAERNLKKVLFFKVKNFSNKWILTQIWSKSVEN